MYIIRINPGGYDAALDYEYVVDSDVPEGALTIAMLQFLKENADNQSPYITMRRVKEAK